MEADFGPRYLRATDARGDTGTSDLAVGHLVHPWRSFRRLSDES